MKTFACRSGLVPVRRTLSKRLSAREWRAQRGGTGWCRGALFGIPRGRRPPAGNLNPTRGKGRNGGTAGARGQRPPFGRHAFRGAPSGCRVMGSSPRSWTRQAETITRGFGRFPASGPGFGNGAPIRPRAVFRQGHGPRSEGTAPYVSRVEGPSGSRGVGSVFAGHMA